MDRSQADSWAAPRWVCPIALLLSLAGFGVSTYLTIAHFTSAVTLACPNTGAINCEKVTSSPQSVLLGVPVAVLGLVFFGVMLVMNRPAAWRRPNGLQRGARLAASALGVGFAVYLIYTELFTIHAICLWCTSAHILAFLTFFVILFGDSLARSDAEQAWAATLT